MSYKNTIFLGDMQLNWLILAAIIKISIMKNMYKSLLVLVVSISLFSCKDDTKKETVADEEGTKTEVVQEVTKAEKKTLTEADDKIVNSVLTRSMMTQELATFSSALVSAGLTDMLANEEGPFTILAPSSEAFAKIPSDKMNTLLNTSNKEDLQQLLKNHMVEGNMDSAALTQRANKSGNGRTLTTLSGAKLTVKMEGDNIVITDASGNKATVGKSDISGSNGVVHVVDAVLEGN